MKKLTAMTVMMAATMMASAAAGEINIPTKEKTAFSRRSMWIF